MHYPALGFLPVEVRASVEQSLDHAPSKGRAVLRALAVTGLAGARPILSYSGGAFRMVDHKGETFTLAVVAFTTPVNERGEPGGVEKLLQALEGALGSWPYRLCLRKALPPGFDPEPVARAVQMWRMAMDRDEWRGRHAIYEDAGISLEISVLPRRTDDQPGKLVAFVPPIVASDRLMVVYERVIDELERLRECAEDDPIVLVAAAEPQWRLPRGFVMEFLYGLPDEVRTEHAGEQPTWRASFRPTGTALFSEPLSRRVAAVWWLEGEGNTLSFAGYAYENPWSEKELPVRFPGLRFAPGSPADGTFMEWTGHDPAWWRSANDAEDRS
jgi:hypothetical protein